MNELLEALEDAPSINKLTYAVAMGKWIVHFKEKRSLANKVNTEDLLFFIRNV